MRVQDVVRSRKRLGTVEAISNAEKKDMNSFTGMNQISVTIVSNFVHYSTRLSALHPTTNVVSPLVAVGYTS